MDVLLFSIFSESNKYKVTVLKHKYSFEKKEESDERY